MKEEEQKRKEGERINREQDSITEREISQKRKADYIKVAKCIWNINHISYSMGKQLV